MISLISLNDHEAHAMIRASTNIEFDANRDGRVEMSLSDRGLAIGSENGASNLHLSGSLGMSVQNIDSDTVLDERSSSSIVIADTSTQNVVLTLPYAGNVSGRWMKIKKISAENRLFICGGGNILTRVPVCGQFISMHEERPSAIIYNSIDICSDGKKWIVLDDQDDMNGSLLNDKDLIAWWRLDEMSGNTMYDSSGHGHHGTLVSSEFLTDSNSGDSIRGGVLLNNRENFINVDFSQKLTPDEMSVSMWAKFNDPQGTPLKEDDSNIPHNFIFSLDGGHDNKKNVKKNSGSLFIRRTNSSANIGVYLRDKENDKYVNIQADNNVEKLQDGEMPWVHVAATFDNSSMKLYINGVQNGGDVTTGFELDFIETDKTIIRLGNIFSGTAGPVQGKIDDVLIYSRVLNDSEVEELFESQL